jgi:hypothetical protein
MSYLSTKSKIRILVGTTKASRIIYFTEAVAKYVEGTDHVDVKDILVEIDAEISRLQQARALLSSEATSKRGPAKSKSVTAPKKRKLTPEGRKRIAEAMKRRWAERKKQAGAKAAK